VYSPPRDLSVWRLACRRLVQAVCAAVCLCAPPAGAQTAAPPDVVILQLPEGPQFRYAGYFAALNRGYFAEEGLQVLIRTPAPQGPHGPSPTEVVVNDTAQFGVCASELVQARLEGKPVVVLATILQQSASCFVSVTDSLISSPADFTGKRLVLSPAGRDADIELRAFLRGSGVALRDITFEELPSGRSPLDALANRSLDAIGGSFTLEPNLLSLRGIPVSVMRPMNFDIDFCGDSLFTTENQVKNHPERVAAFRRASLKGWRYALDHRDEVIESRPSASSSSRT
jgi:ABC-type nitrate/sulfonate/bicarbonate transport system substrate-binding protein